MTIINKIRPERWHTGLEAPATKTYEMSLFPRNHKVGRKQFSQVVLHNNAVAHVPPSKRRVRTINFQHFNSPPSAVPPEMPALRGEAGGSQDQGQHALNSRLSQKRKPKQKDGYLKEHRRRNPKPESPYIKHLKTKA